MNGTYRKRQKHFVSHLEKKLELLGYVTIIYIYLKNQSLVELVTRGLVQLMVAHPFPSTTTELLQSQSGRRVILKMLFLLPIWLNLVFIALQLLFGDKAYSGYGYGIYTILVVGEKAGSSVCVILNELFLIGLQILLFSVWMTDQFLSSSQQPSDGSSDDECEDHAKVDDGYSGEVMAVSISAQNIMGFLWQGDDEEEEELQRI